MSDSVAMEGQPDDIGTGDSASFSDDTNSSKDGKKLAGLKRMAEPVRRTMDAKKCFAYRQRKKQRLAALQEKVQVDIDKTLRCGSILKHVDQNEIGKAFVKLSKIQDIQQRGQAILHMVRVETWVGRTEDDNIPKLKSLKSAWKTNPTQELGREFRISICMETKKKNKYWRSLFTVKESTIKDGGYGVFANQPFKAKTVLGLYHGEIAKDDGTVTCHAMRSSVDGDHVILDPRGGIGSSRPACVGMHFVNDPTWRRHDDSSNDSSKNTPRRGNRAGGSASDDRRRLTRSSTMDHNIMVGEDMLVRALLDIKVGDELFFCYKMDGGCDCNGCSELNKWFAENQDL